MILRSAKAELSEKISKKAYEDNCDDRSALAERKTQAAAMRDTCGCDERFTLLRSKSHAADLFLHLGWIDPILLFVAACKIGRVESDSVCGLRHIKSLRQQQVRTLQPFYAYPLVGRLAQFLLHLAVQGRRAHAKIDGSPCRGG